MSGQWTVPAWLVLVAAAAIGVLVVVALAAVLQRRRAETEAAQEVAEVAEVRRRLEALEHRLAASPAARTAEPAHDYLITRLGQDDPAAEAAPVAAAPVLPPGQFTEVLVREGVLRSASLAHGLRRALSPESRNRIRFEMRREVKRQRKVRRAETREALRDWQARRRADPDAAA